MKVKITTLQNVLGGQILVRNSRMARHWKLVLYIFFLMLLYISFHYGVRHTKERIVENEDLIRYMRSEYIMKYTSILNMSKRGEIEMLLKKNGSDLVPPENPPTMLSDE